RGAGPGGANCNSDPAEGSSVTLRHVPRVVLVAGEDVADARTACERVVGRQDRPARDPEDDVHTFRLERAENRVGAEHLHAATPANSVSVRAPGRAARRTSMNSRVVAPTPDAIRSGVCTPS